ncbi:helix-turn-helix domain-containing protein [Gulosibacter bifidus]|uniref:Helix-turn-helix domain-containing protein n=1 Tax=Gulosibacter bifidus TaxID=272239 RepID=A0ABW5RK23_9MICO|nr:helix-turn-helix transcriptional regulator [Gulosibacter bifidus]
MTTQEAQSADDTFGPAFAAARKAVGVNQQEVTAAVANMGINLPVSALSKIEKGQRRVTVGEAAALAEAVGVDLGSLVGRYDTLATTYGWQVQKWHSLKAAVTDYTETMVELFERASYDMFLKRKDRDTLTHIREEQTPINVAAVAHEAALRYIKEQGYSAPPTSRLGKLIDQLETDSRLAQGPRSTNDV